VVKTFGSWLKTYLLVILCNATLQIAQTFLVEELLTSYINVSKTALARAAGFWSCNIV